MVTTPSSAPSPRSERRFRYGFWLGLVPAVLMCLFGFTQCPPGTHDGYICAEQHADIGGWLFVLAVAIYALNALLMLVCVLSRSWRPFARALLFMLVLAPILGIFGFFVITTARHPSGTDMLLPAHFW